MKYIINPHQKQILRDDVLMSMETEQLVQHDRVPKILNTNLSLKDRLKKENICYIKVFVKVPAWLLRMNTQSWGHAVSMCKRVEGYF